MLKRMHFISLTSKMHMLKRNANVDILYFRAALNYNRIHNMSGISVVWWLIKIIYSITRIVILLWLNTFTPILLSILYQKIFPWQLIEIWGVLVEIKMHTNTSYGQVLICAKAKSLYSFEDQVANLVSDVGLLIRIITAVSSLATCHIKLLTDKKAS